MGKVVSIINLKGGVGKTTLAVCLGEFLGFVFKKTVLLIDMDHQTNLTYAMLPRELSEASRTSGKTIFHMFKKALDGEDWSLRDFTISGCSNIDQNSYLRLIASLPDVGHLDEMILEKYEDRTGAFRLDPRRILEDKIGQAKKEYDYILIDCPPSLGLPTINALLASDYFIVPVVPEFLSLQGLDLIMKRVGSLKNRYHVDVEFAGTILNRISIQRTDHKEWSEVLFLSPGEKEKCKKELDNYARLLKQGDRDGAMKSDIQKLTFALILRGLGNTDFRPFNSWLGDLKPFYLVTDYSYPERKKKMKKYPTIEKKYDGVGSAPDERDWPHLGRGVKHYDLFGRCRELADEFIKRCS